jgi:hypothetical protein
MELGVERDGELSGRRCTCTCTKRVLIDDGRFL